MHGMVRLEKFHQLRLAMHKWVFAIIFFVLLLFPLGTRAQNPVSLDSLRVQIWPEYDKPGVLVIYQMTLPANTIYPVTLSVRIPASAGEPFAVADRQPDGQLYNLNYSTKVVDEWVVITFTTTSPEIRIEYYDPELITDGAARHYSYIWAGDFAVNRFLVEVQQPAGATDMRISPSLGPGTTHDDNLVYYTQDIGAIPAGQNLSLTLDYNKTTDSLTAESLPVEPSAPIPQSTVTNFNVSAWLPWILGILGAGLIIGGIIWFWQSGKQRPARKIRHRRSSASVIEPAQPSGKTGEAVYCSQCGKRASTGDLFCRSCGTKIQNK
jgi:hypothetical protein